MPMSRIDLNLFSVFDAIYREGGITPASKRLHLSQPAVSHALARLRDLLQDPLFERHGNEMRPTPRARALASTISRSLGSLEQMLERPTEFDPHTAERGFVIAMRESHETSLLPALGAALEAGSPMAGIQFACVRNDRRDLEEDLQSGELDLALDIALPLSAEIKRLRLCASPLVVLARPDHALVQGSLDLETYLAQEHVLVTGRRRGAGYEDGVLERLGRTRRIRLRCQQHRIAVELVRRTDLLVTLPRDQALLLNRSSGNQILAFPVEIAPFESYLYWHANVDEDPANRWFRGFVSHALQLEAEDAGASTGGDVAPWSRGRHHDGSTES